MTPTLPASSIPAADPVFIRAPRLPRITLPHPAIVSTLVTLARAGFPVATVIS
jgi:hypothetical protein